MKACFLSSVQFSRPLDPTSRAKFQALCEGHEISVIGFSKSLVPRCFQEHARFYLLPSLPGTNLRYFALLLISPWLAMWCVLHHGAKILVAQSPYEGVAAAWSKIAAGFVGTRVALVVESHGDFERAFFFEKRVRFRRLYTGLMRRFAEFSLRHADVLRAISRATEKQLRQRAAELPLYQFPTWTNIDAFLEAGAERVADEGQQILFVGVLTPLKGVHHLVTAFRTLAPEYPAARLVIVGRAVNRSYANELRAEVERSDVAERVSFHEEMPQEKLAGWMARSCVLVLPSLSEGLGRVLIEAMATGTPVIGSNVGGIPQLIEEGRNGFLIAPGDASALAERLRFFLSRPEEARAMGERARAYARELFSTEAYVEGYDEVFTAAAACVDAESGGGNPGQGSG